MGRFQPLPVAYIEVSEIEKFCLKVFGCNGLMARVKIVKESFKVCRIWRAVSETEKDSDDRETNIPLSGTHYLAIAGTLTNCKFLL